MFSSFRCWDTWTRTKNDRTRICSVTITPYPNMFCFLFRIAMQNYYFFLNMQKNNSFFQNI